MNGLWNIFLPFLPNQIIACIWGVEEILAPAESTAHRGTPTVLPGFSLLQTCTRSDPRGAGLSNVADPLPQPMHSTPQTAAWPRAAPRLGALRAPSWPVIFAPWGRLASPLPCLRALLDLPIRAWCWLYPTSGPQPSPALTGPATTAARRDCPTLRHRIQRSTSSSPAAPRLGASACERRPSMCGAPAGSHGPENV